MARLCVGGPRRNIPHSKYYTYRRYTCDKEEENPHLTLPTMSAGVTSPLNWIPGFFYSCGFFHHPHLNGCLYASTGITSTLSEKALHIEMAISTRIPRSSCFCFCGRKRERKKAIGYPSAALQCTDTPQSNKQKCESSCRRTWIANFIPLGKRKVRHRSFWR